MILWTSLLVFLAVHGTRGHDWSFGSCPSITPFSGLSVDKFLGLWYVMEQYDTTAKCLTLNYTRESETSLKVTKNRQYSLLDRAGLNHTNYYTGSLDIPLAENQAYMRVKWPLNAAGKADYIIFDTDYENYAGVYDCQQVSSLFYRQSAAILSRTPDLDEIYIDRVRRRLETFDVPLSHLDRIDHTDCRSRDESRYNVGVDGDSIKSFFSKTVDSISTAAGVVADGVQDAATYVVNGIRQVTSSNQDAETVGSIKEKDTIKK